MICNIYIYIYKYKYIQIYTNTNIYKYKYIQIKLNVVYIGRGYTKPNPFFLSPASSLSGRIVFQYRRPGPGL